MRRAQLLVVGLAAYASGLAQARQDSATFHHLHLFDPSGARIVEFYQRLFDPAVTKRFSLDGDEALQAGPIALVVSVRPRARTGPAPADEAKRDGQASQSPRAADAPRTAIWHYGWGEVSLNESYLDHNLREVAWEPPLPAGRFHLHVESVSPNAAAMWYRDQLGARVELAAPFDEDTISDDLRRSRAVAWFGGVALVFYRADRPLVPTRGQRADHIAFEVDDLERAFARLIVSGATAIEPPQRRDAVRLAMIEGPDRMAIELVER
jgi:catechol 2,3-dioxygenase-like lactoylglutathione lyase family enzyme